MIEKGISFEEAFH